MLGEMIGEFKGKTTGVRVLSEGKMELSQQGIGKIMGVDASIVTTGVASQMPNGVMMVEANGSTMTMDGDVIMVKIDGIGWHAWQGLEVIVQGSVLSDDDVTKARSYEQDCMCLGT